MLESKIKHTVNYIVTERYKIQRRNENRETWKGK